ncbi:hypothetical protein ACFPRL_28535 [Pseudoclavibacter helvolus]
MRRQPARLDALLAHEVQACSRVCHLHAPSTVGVVRSAPRWGGLVLVVGTVRLTSRGAHPVLRQKSSGGGR